MIQAQKNLIKIWRKILKINSVNPADNFFYAGGDSYKALELAAAIKEKFKIDVSLADVLKNPTFTSLRRFIDNRQKRVNRPIKPAGRAFIVSAAGLSAEQISIWQAMQTASSQLIYVPITYRLNGPLNLAAVRQSFRLLIKRHYLLRTAIFEKKDKTGRLVLKKEIRPYNKNAFFYINLSGQEEKVREKTEIKIVDEQRKKISLEKGWPLKIILIKESPDQFMLVILLHLALIDGPTVQLLPDEFKLIYEALVSKKTPSFSYPLRQYDEYVVWQQKKLAERDLSTQEKFWSNYLAGGNPSPAFPDLKKSAGQDKLSVFTKKIPLSAKTKELALAFCKKEEISPYVFFFSFFSLFLQVVTGDADLIIDTAISKRESNRLKNIVGPIYNRLPIRAVFKNGLSFKEALLANRSNILQAMTNSDFRDFQRLKNLAQKRLNRTAPIFNTYFDYNSFRPLKNLVNQSDGKRVMASLIIHEKSFFQDDNFYDLTCCVYRYDNNLDLYFIYKHNLFLKSAADELTEKFIRLLEIIIKNPQDKIFLNNLSGFC